MKRVVEMKRYRDSFDTIKKQLGPRKCGKEIRYVEKALDEYETLRTEHFNLLRRISEADMKVTKH